MHRDRATPATGRENATRSTRPAPHASLPALLMLQRTIGNQAVLQTLVVQRTLDSTARKDWRELMIWDAHELEKVKSFIANHKEDVDELLHAVFEHKWRPEFGPVVNQLVEAGAGINFALEGGNTVLHKAAMREQATAVEFLLKVSGINVNPTNVDDATPLDVGYDAAVFALLKRAGGISGQERQLLQDKTKADARLNNILQNPHTAPPSVGTADTIATLKSGALAETKATYDLFAASLDELAGYHNEWVDLILDIGALLTTLQGYNTILPNASGVDAVVPGAKGFGYVRPIGSGLQQVFITSDPVKSAVTTLHEYTHLALMRAFQNRSKPFARENESVDKAHVEALAKATDEDEKNVQSVTTMSQVVADEVKKIFAAFREYSTDLQPDEIISHVSEMIYQTLKANVGIAQLDLGVPKLMAYLRTKVEPELRKLRRELRSAARLRQPTPSAATNAPPATPTLTSGLTAAISPLDKDDALRRRAQLLVGKLESAIQAITTLEAAKAAPGTEAKPPKLPDPSDVQADLSDAARQHTQVTTLLSKKQPSGSVTTDQLLEIGNQLTALQQLQTTLAQRLNAAKP